MIPIYSPPFNSWLKHLPKGSFLFLPKENCFATLQEKWFPRENFIDRIYVPMGSALFVRQNNDHQENWAVDTNGCGGLIKSYELLKNQDKPDENR